jgi:peptidoglycan/xylan/chitin deacetylase (PgdA/CDA1 family)
MDPAMNPRSRKMKLLAMLPRRWVLTDAGRRSRTLYLTFDDGPHPAHTPPLLDLLAEHGAKASFFVVGSHAEDYPALAQRIVDEGHLLGNHSYSHPQFAHLRLPQQVAEVQRTDEVLAAFDGCKRHLFRPPRGHVSARMLWYFARHRIPLALWSYDSLDYARPGVEALVAMANRHPSRAGDLILMHDDDSLSLAWLRTMLPVWKAGGFSFEALPFHA